MRHVFCGALLLAALTASAQSTLPENFAAERLRLNASRSGIIDTAWAALPERLSWDVGLWASYSKNPLVLYRLSDGQRVGSLLSERLGFALVGSISFNRRIALELELPMVGLNQRPETIDMVTTAPLPSISGFSVGDVKVTPKVGLLRYREQLIDLAFQATLTIPSAQGQRYAGDNGITFLPELLISRPFGNLRVALNLGANIRPNAVSFLNQNIDSEGQLRLGVAYRFNQVDAKALPLELAASLMAGTSLATPFKNANQNPAELKVLAAYEFNSLFQLYAGGGVGLSHGWGVPDFRVLAGIRVGDWNENAKAIRDEDNDAVADGDDRCPGELEDLDGYQDTDGCPEPDNDLDGILDGDDACPNLKGLKENRGCPVEKPKETAKPVVKVTPKTAADDKDTDKDHILDSSDRCPDQAEDFDSYEDSDGCPKIDNDLDGIADTEDFCPLEKGPIELLGCPDRDFDSDGVPDRFDNCPKAIGDKKNAGCSEHQVAVLAKGKLTLFDPVRFLEGKTVIDEKSYEVLDNIAAILKEHPEIEKLKIESHTDNQGTAAKNQRISQDKASAVKTYLVKKGISTKRLEGIGWGQNKPIADNKTPIGRLRNARIEFNFAPIMPSKKATAGETK